MHIITRNKFLIIGVVLIACSFILFLIVFGPLIYQESKYQVEQTLQTNKEQDIATIDPINKGFTVIIPKISAEANIIPDVDPYNKNEYLQALTSGVAHAKGSAKPGEIGNTFLFAHSSDNFYNANRYNSVFYLLYKLDVGDEIYITHNNELFSYKVNNKQIVKPENIEFLSEETGDEVLTLMTCWPPGTTYERLIIKGERVNRD